MLLFLHGFNSSPVSHKATTFKAWATENLNQIFEVPYIKPYPAEAVEQLCQIIEKALEAGEEVGLVGSSLGGFYANYLANKYKLRAVLVNPAISPYDSLDEYIGENKNFYNDDHYLFEQKHVDELRQFQVREVARPKDLLLMVQTGDETLNFREATEKYQHCENIIEYGGDHGFQDFQRWFSYIIHFLKLS